MKRIAVLVTLIIVMLTFLGCNKRINDLTEMDEECEILVRNDLDSEYLVITNEIIKNNVLHFLNETISQEEIVVSKSGEIPVTGDKIKVTDLKGEDYFVSFSIYYVDAFSDGGKEVIIVENGKGSKKYYYSNNDLEDFISLALTDSNTFLAKVVGMTKQQLQVASNIFGSLTLQSETIPEDIKVGSEVEITLGNMTETSKGLYAQSIIKK